jgi:hypothetical protein
MKYIILLTSLLLVSCETKTGAVEFKLSDIPYATSSEAVGSKEFKFPKVPYAQ